nr:PREDICTED: GTPase-activating protein CdGAPr isoform X2 [Bemisia tabaci]
MFVEQPPSLLGTMSSLGGSQRRTRALADIVPSCASLKGSLDESRSGGSLRMTSVTGSFEGRSRFPKLEDCAHFHYEHVELGPIQISLYDEEDLKPLSSLEGNNENCENKYLTVKVISGDQSWLLRRTYDNFRMLDKQLHRCIYDRKFSALPELPYPIDNLQDKTDPEAYIRRLLVRYLERLSHIAGSLINCGPVLSWLELDNRGRRLLVTGADNCLINTPAVAGAYAIKQYNAVAADEISFDVGDMISVIDMPPPEESSWWRGKKGFLVGFFPFHCVAVITDKVPRTLHLHQVLSATEPSKPVLRKHGKLIAFFRAFILARPSRRRLKQTGILRERVFGCDLGEHLLNSGHDIPMVLKCCSEFIEKHGIVDGIYRLSGVTSNIQKLRSTFDEDRVPKLYDDEAILQDIHSVASLLKMYFRELPNPLCTYQLYHSFVTAVQQEEDNIRLAKMRETVQKLPPPHYRTLEYLMRHLARVAERGESTGMTARNVAIVWAPNLLRCKELEVGGVAALQVVGVQAVVTEFLIRWQHLIFTSNIHHLPPPHGTPKKSRPKSLAVSTPTRLLSLEEAQSRVLLGKPDQDYIEVGGGPSCLPKEYHTVIELPSRKRGGSKRSPLGWKSLFSRGSSSVSSSSRKSRSPATCKAADKRKTSIPSDIKFGHTTTETESQLLEVKTNLRPVRSAESLTSGSAHNSARNSSCLETPPPRLPITSPPSVPGHNRSSSHDSYFDHLAESTSEKISSANEHDDEGLSLSLDLSEIQVNFDLEESEMKIFTEDETNQFFSSPSNSEQMQTLKRQPMLALTEDSLSSDPSPKKHKTDADNKGDIVTNNLSKRCRLEERLSSGELQYIDSQSPEQILTQVDVHSRDESQSPSETTFSENGSLSMSTPRLNYTPLTEDSFSDGNLLTPEYSLLKYSASTFHSPSSLDASPADSPFGKSRHSYQDTPNSRTELLPNRRSFPGFLTSPLTDVSQYEVLKNESETCVDDSKKSSPLETSFSGYSRLECSPSQQYEIFENEKESNADEKKSSNSELVSSPTESLQSNRLNFPTFLTSQLEVKKDDHYGNLEPDKEALIADDKSGSNELGGHTPSSTNDLVVYENVPRHDNSPVVYENMSVSRDVKYEPIDDDSCYEDVFFENPTSKKRHVCDLNNSHENIRLIQDDDGSMNSMSSSLNHDLQKQVETNICDDSKEETMYENVPDSKELYQQVKFFKRSVTEINQMLDHDSQVVQMTETPPKSEDKLVDMDTSEDVPKLTPLNKAENESFSHTQPPKSPVPPSEVMLENSPVGNTSASPKKEGQDSSIRNPENDTGNDISLTGSNSLLINLNDQDVQEPRTEERPESRNSESDGTKSVHQLLSCFEVPSIETSPKKYSSKDSYIRTSNTDLSKPVIAKLGDAGKLMSVEKIPENETDLDRRKRIEKYKEERRNFLRQKYSVENLKSSEESDVVRRYKLKSEGKESGPIEKVSQKSEDDSLQNKSESQKISADSTTVSDNHSRRSVLDKCLNLELKKAPPNLNLSETNLKKPIFARSVSDNGVLSSGKTLISICYSPTRKTITPETDTKSAAVQDEVSASKENATCITIKHKSSEDGEKPSQKLKLKSSVDYSSRERSGADFRSSPEKKEKEKISPESKGIVSQRVNQLIGPADGVVPAPRKTSLSHQRQIPVAVNRQRAHSASDRITPYCIKEMAALFEKPEELTKKS